MLKHHQIIKTTNYLLIFKSKYSDNILFTFTANVWSVPSALYTFFPCGQSPCVVARHKTIGPFMDAVRVQWRRTCVNRDMFRIKAMDVPIWPKLTQVAYFILYNTRKIYFLVRGTYILVIMTNTPYWGTLKLRNPNCLKDDHLF